MSPPRYSAFPPISKSREAVLEVIREATAPHPFGAALGIDFEYDPETRIPHIIGVATRERAAAWHWSTELGAAAAECGVPLVAYAGVGADKPVLEAGLRIVTPLERWEDSMLRHWCVNPDLSSVPKASIGEDSKDTHVLGMMNLWVACSMVHDVPQWKECVGVDQCIRERRPCPTHDELAYCAVDAWAGLVTDDSLRAQMAELSIPEHYYEFRRRVANVCEAMQRKGVAIDRSVIDALETAIQAKKAVLFPYRMEPLGKNGRPLKNPRRVWTGPFNPNSPKAVCDWFSSNGIELRDRGGKFSMGKAVVLAALNRKLRPFGLEFDVERGDVIGDFDPERPLPEPLDLLVRLAQKTCAGKGLKSWFDSQYIRNGEAHPRFNPVGTSMSRLSSSRPNFQNIPRVGFGAEVRRAVVARPGYKLVKQDYSQGEFRICLWRAGGAAALARADGAFELLVERSNGAFREAAARQNWTERDVAKSAIHAANYLESLSLRKASELDTKIAIGDRRAGALWVFDGHDLPEWTFRGRYVCFTGRNIAERLFGDYTRESRAKALRIIGIYFEAFSEIREFQRGVLRDIELTGEVRLLSGHRLPLYGRIREDDVKQAVACEGQGGLAIYAQEGLLRLEDAGITPNLQVHDEVVVEVPVDWSDEQCLTALRPVVEPSVILPGFTCPAKVKVGPNWKDMNEIGVLRYEAPAALAIK